MKRPSPLVQMTMALVALSSTLVILATLFVDAIPDRNAQARALRKTVGEALAVQLAEMLRREEPREIEKTMASVVARTEGLRSVGVRRADGTLVLDVGGHARGWKQDEGERSRPEQVSVPLNAQGQRWGRVELAFAADDTPAAIAFFKQPLVHMMLFIGVAGWLVFGLYMRRTLQHLDPAAVVPERVQGAFDAMAEGVVVLDARGRVMLSNKAFRSLNPQLADLPIGNNLTALPWLGAALVTDPARQPWTRAMSERQPNAGTTVEAGEGEERRQLVLNAAPIADVGGAVRGCMVTVSDMTALHRANEALRAAMDDLGASKREVELKNQELERLATRDPLTGALNRRAFYAAFDALLRPARKRGIGVSCLMVDIDHFKRINDDHGHGVGDRVIQEVARRLQDSVRGTDLVCRWGGEEFCVVVSGLGAVEATELAERIRMRIERECGAAVREVPGLRVTASIGVEPWQAVGDNLPALIERADRSLYHAKRSGRNRVETSAAGSVAGGAVDDDQIDAASGCLNAKGWLAALRTLSDTAKAEDRVLACLISGLDDFALQVDRHGMAQMEQASVALARWARESAPASAAVARLDARRVGVLIAGMGIEECEAMAEYQRRRAEEGLAGVVDGAEPRSMTISVGVDALPASSPAIATLAERAEQAMGRARRAGGNGCSTFAGGRPASPATRGSGV